MRSPTHMICLAAIIACAMVAAAVGSARSVIGADAGEGLDATFPRLEARTIRQRMTTDPKVFAAGTTLPELTLLMEVSPDTPELFVRAIELVRAERQAHTPALLAVMARAWRLAHDPRTGEPLRAGMDELLAHQQEAMEAVKGGQAPPMRLEELARAIHALAEGHLALEDDRYLHGAEALATFLVDHLREDPARFYAIYEDGAASGQANGDAMAAVIEALLSLFRQSRGTSWLQAAVGSADGARHRLFDGASGGWSPQAGAPPQAATTAAMAVNMIGIYERTGDKEYLDTALRSLAFLQGEMEMLSPAERAQTAIALHRLQARHPAALGDGIKAPADKETQRRRRVEFTVQPPQIHLAPSEPATLVVTMELPDSATVCAPEPGAAESANVTGLDVRIAGDAATIEVAYPDAVTRTVAEAGSLRVLESPVKLTVTLSAAAPPEGDTLRLIVSYQLCADGRLHPLTRRVLPVRVLP